MAKHFYKKNMKQRPRKINDNDYGDNTSKFEESTELSIKVPKQKYIETPVNDGDTLQALSIRHHCPVAELKRINNIHRDNEIFARPSLKIPYRAFSVPAVHKSGNNSPDNVTTKISINPTVLKEKLTSVSNLNKSLPSNEALDESHLKQIIFNTTISNQIDNNEENSDTSDEEVQLLPNSNVSHENTKSKNFTCNGADWGLSWPILLFIILLMSLIGPLIYVFYIAEHPHHHS